MSETERVFYAVIALGLMALVALQLPAPPIEPCRGLVMADCGQR